MAIPGLDKYFFPLCAAQVHNSAAAAWSYLGECKTRAVYSVNRAAFFGEGSGSGPPSSVSHVRKLFSLELFKTSWQLKHRQWRQFYMEISHQIMTKFKAHMHPTVRKYLGIQKWVAFLWHRQTKDKPNNSVVDRKTGWGNGHHLGQDSSHIGNELRVMRHRGMWNWTWPALV